MALCSFSVGVVVSSTIRIWKLRYSFAITHVSQSTACPVIVVAVLAVARRHLFNPLLYVEAHTRNPSPDLRSNGTYFSSRIIHDEAAEVVTPIAQALPNTH